ncbi:MAG: tRNA 4-thiouridine(8) synthase ThiI [Planctomycetes bacterium]|nr:tRNA 4-thiouridine(8) synthase ThiI [Planctomycetota bacterium]
MSEAEPTLGAPERVVVRYGELALKGGNRVDFERALVRNLKDALKRIAPVVIERQRGRLLVTPEARAEEIAERAARVFGVKSVSPAWGCPSDPEAIARLARAVFLDALAQLPRGVEPSMRVRSNRADKRFPMTSIELDRYLGDRVLGGIDGVRVQMDEPAIELGVDVRMEGVSVFARRIAGPGGLPVGTQGRGLCLLSGGIDSPVAAWMSMKRGLAMSFIGFHSWPYIGEASKQKVITLARSLCEWQSRARLYIVPFAPIQLAIRDRAPASYRTILYRRMMQRIASRISERDGQDVLVTGESLGQVASQTLDNLRCIELAASRSVLRPLVALDKEEIIAIARRIGTFEISNVQEPDCCTVFLPEHPVIRGVPSECERFESELDVEGLVSTAIAEVEILRIER